MFILRSIWWVLINVGYLILILIISLFLFTVPAQAKDFIYVFVQQVDWLYISLVAAFLTIWSFVSWYSASIILQIDPLATNLTEEITASRPKLAKLVPRALGIFPCLILFFAIIVVPYGNSAARFFYCLSLAGVAGALWAFFFQLDKRKTALSNPKGTGATINYAPAKGTSRFINQLKRQHSPYAWPTMEEVREFRKCNGGKVPSWNQHLMFIFNYKWVKSFYLIFGSLAIILLVLFSIPWLNFQLATTIKPASVLILSITFFTFVFTLISYFHDYSERPFAIGVIIWVLFWSIFNDNTGLSHLDKITQDNRLTVEEAFQQWLQVKSKTWIDIHNTDTMPVIFIASEGGGIRGLNWTTRVLVSLEQRFPGFYNQTFVISGVSGGGVGAAHYAAYQYDRWTGKVNHDSDPSFRKFTQEDFLSPVTAAFSFGDNLQKVIPWPVEFLERSKILGKTWDWSYEKQVGTTTMSESFLSLWYGNEGFDYRMPSLILNGVLAENGQRVVTSNLKLHGSKWFADDIDFFSSYGKNVSISTAALNCCRFPIITSGACLLQGDTLKRGHIIDGGYRENTGLQTIYNVYSTIKDHLDPQKHKIFIIYLKNGVDELNGEARALTFMHDLGTPLLGLYTVNGTGMPAKGIVQFFYQTFSDSTFFEMKLENRDSHEIKLPLGWYMSDVVAEEIDKRVKRIDHFDSVLVKEMRKYWK